MMDDVFNVADSGAQRRKAFANLPDEPYNADREAFDEEMHCDTRTTSAMLGNTLHSFVRHCKGVEKV